MATNTAHMSKGTGLSLGWIGIIVALIGFIWAPVWMGIISIVLGVIALSTPSTTARGSAIAAVILGAVVLISTFIV
ncbi:hypothetical protein ACFO3D_18100 [Virgibacillus kekensis]|uniref:C4-dicarboxylate ABC transporter n=1 Tax=Virgibacillus kekensis TaxID=202261 RepID=A0ABV9DME2_9BACI